MATEGKAVEPHEAYGIMFSHSRTEIENDVPKRLRSLRRDILELGELVDIVDSPNAFSGVEE
jgi:hypothetical protein